ncbi:MAG: hypothetical protein CMQ53_01620 [Gammaproteobacteria bacterium]|nr:hypothetical protein [Gammaproteobacteria bacterium]
MIQLKGKDNWEWKPLKFIFNYFLSSVDRKFKEEELNVHICHYPDVYKNEKISNKDNLNKGTCTEFELENFKLKKGDILITKDSEDPKDIGIPCLIENDIVDSVCGYHIGILRTNENIEREFYFRYIQSTDVKDYFFCESNGITRFGLGKSSVENLKIPILSIQEQKIISQYLDKKTKQIDSLIEKIDKKIKLLKEQKTALINQFITKGLDPNFETVNSENEWIHEIPNRWKKLKISYLIDIRDGTHDTPSYIDSTDGFPLITQKDIDGDKINFLGNKYISSDDHLLISKRSKVSKGDIIMSMIGSIGFPTIVNTNKEFSIKNLALFKTSNSNENPEFIKFVLESEYIKMQLDLEKGGGVQKFVSLETLRNLKIIIPEINEQNEIIYFLNKQLDLIQKLIVKEIKKHKLLNEYRQSLISSVVTGKIQITEDML